MSLKISRVFKLDVTQSLLSGQPVVSLYAIADGETVGTNSVPGQDLSLLCKEILHQWALLTLPGFCYWLTLALALP